MQEFETQSHSGLKLAVKKLEETIVRIKSEKSKPGEEDVRADMIKDLQTQLGKLKETRDSALQQEFSKWVIMANENSDSDDLVDSFEDLGHLSPAQQPSSSK